LIAYEGETKNVNPPRPFARACHGYLGGTRRVGYRIMVTMFIHQQYLHSTVLSAFSCSHSFCGLVT
jgi:hypothetical protein